MMSGGQLGIKDTVLQAVKATRQINTATAKK